MSCKELEMKKLMNKLYINHMFEWEKINMYEVCCTRCMGGGGVIPVTLQWRC